MKSNKELFDLLRNLNLWLDAHILGCCDCGLPSPYEHILRLKRLADYLRRYSEVEPADVFYFSVALVGLLDEHMKYLSGKKISSHSVAFAQWLRKFHSVLIGFVREEASPYS
ncbi:MAG: hypothetical protein KTR20_15390 [Cellvibrionaceae bacterium]|nr:hypothetical protein [Cellvibrionaceae bacterium]